MNAYEFMTQFLMDDECLCVRWLWVHTESAATSTLNRTPCRSLSKALKSNQLCTNQIKCTPFHCFPQLCSKALLYAVASGHIRLTSLICVYTRTRVCVCVQSCPWFEYPGPAHVLCTVDALLIKWIQHSHLRSNSPQVGCEYLISLQCFFWSPDRIFHPQLSVCALWCSYLPVQK